MLKKILAAVGVILFLGVLLVGGAVVTGYVVVGDPGAAATQILTGDFEEPDVAAEEMEIGPVGAPEGGMEDIDQDGATFRNEFRIDNPNHIGGVVSLVEYDVYMAGSRDGEYEYVGNGSIRDLRVPPNGTVTERNEFDVAYDDLITATGVAGPAGLVGGATWYARVEGVATVDLGPVSFDVEFETVEEVGR
jgi:hypothetical protein